MGETAAPVGVPWRTDSSAASPALDYTRGRARQLIERDLGFVIDSDEPEAAVVEGPRGGEIGDAEG